MGFTADVLSGNDPSGVPGCSKLDFSAMKCPTCDGRCGPLALLAICKVALGPVHVLAQKPRRIERGEVPNRSHWI